MGQNEQWERPLAHGQREIPEIPRQPTEISHTRKGLFFLLHLHDVFVFPFLPLLQFFFSGPVTCQTRCCRSILCPWGTPFLLLTNLLQVEFWGANRFLAFDRPPRNLHNEYNTGKGGVKKMAMEAEKSERRVPGCSFAADWCTSPIWSVFSRPSDGGTVRLGLVQVRTERRTEMATALVVPHDFLVKLLVSYKHISKLLILEIIEHILLIFCSFSLIYWKCSYFSTFFIWIYFCVNITYSGFTYFIFYYFDMVHK